MKIWSNTITTVGKNKVKIFPGVGNYDINYKDPETAQQLRVLRKHNMLLFREILDGDIKRPEKNKRPAEETRPADGDNLCNRKIQEQTTDAGSGCSEIPERRDGDDNPVTVRRTRRTKKQLLEDAD